MAGYYLYKHISYAVFPSRIGNIKYNTFMIQILNDEIIKKRKTFKILSIVPLR